MPNMKKHPFLHVDFDTTIKLSISDQKKLKLWLAWSSMVIEKLVKKEKIIPKRKAKSFRVSVILCSDARIKKLNRDHRGKDKVTDVLSFPHYEDLRKKLSPVELANGELFLGDLAISHAQTKRQAKEFAIDYFDEFIHLFFHGLIHLMGFDHEVSLKEELLMESWEKEAIDLFSRVKKKGGA
jgi:probable rRNA maturation factor